MIQIGLYGQRADRITFEEIFEKTGRTEGEVIKIMRKNLKPKFGLWKRFSKSIKNKTICEKSRKDQ